MLILSLSMMLILILTVVVMMVAQLVSKKTFMDREKNSPFECGFDPKNSGRMPFSLQFFLIAIIFLIFDIELTLLMPLILVYKMSNFMNTFMIATVFIIILTFGLFHEWKQGALNWAK
uniref:NADH-ubiquinone oxidoreductase chain 3 n=1 Tax=Chauliognathus opacus TaxID=528223 RepID=D1G5K2_CHAOP|nr:NADH dehydrogenase subunit 3 [Chauliognathus opacus]ACM45017.1 NADH dehydrogenase subunit 3 [Chauliognathus opacus]